MASCMECIHFNPCNTYCSAFKNKADFVEVVRCKDCKHRTGTKMKCSMFDDIQMDRNHFCSYGERKEK